jgi:hypothetical protein
VALTDKRQGLHPHGGPADCRPVGRARCKDRRKIDPPIAADDVRFLAEMDDVVDPTPVQGNRAVTRFGVHPDLAPNQAPNQSPKPPRVKSPPRPGLFTFIVRAEPAL